MKSAVELEDGTEKSAVTPGPLAPARELLGEMLLEMNEPAQALEQFEITLAKEPGRFRALRRGEVGNFRMAPDSGVSGIDSQAGLSIMFSLRYAFAGTFPG
jgi:hypothetical protein